MKRLIAAVVAGSSAGPKRLPMLRHSLSIGAFLLLFSFSSQLFAADKFFGVKILDTKQILTALANVRTNPEGGVLYSVRSEYADDSVCAFATVSRGEITFSIQNGSKAPLKLNYFVDKFELMTKDQAIYELEKPRSSVSNYPTILNPGDSESIRVVGYKGKAEDIMYLSATIGLSDTFIFLHRIGPADPKSGKSK